MILNLRPADMADAGDLLAWRNHPLTRAQSRHTGEVAWETHLSWLTRMLADSGCLFLVGWRDGCRVGVVRFNHDQARNCWEVSIIVAPDGQGQGVGRALLAQGIVELRRHHPAARVLAAARPGNSVSERLFAGAGFVAIPSDEEFGHFVLEA